MRDVIKGKAYVVGDNIDTDMIIPARYLNTMDPNELKLHAMEDLDPERHPVPFLKEGKSDYKVIVASNNFGCGSSREHAPIALAAAGVEAVVAPSFARIYYRNSVNGGIILPLESTEDLTTLVRVVDQTPLINTGDEVEIRLSERPTIHVHGQEYTLRPFGPVKDIIEAGGLTAYNKRKLGL